MHRPASLALDLRQSRAFAELDEPGLLALAQRMKHRALAAGATLFVEGAPGDSMAVLTRGRLSVQVRRPGGGLVDVAQVKPGELVGEMASIDPGPRSATVVAAQESEVLELDRAGLRALQVHAPAVAVHVVGHAIRGLSRRLRETDRQIARELARRGSVTPARPALPGTAQRPGPATVPRPAPGALPSFPGLTATDVEMLSAITPTRLYPPGTDLCREGEPATSCFLLARGEVEVWTDVSGEARRLATLGAGSIVGQTALVDRAPRSATVRARTEATVMELHRGAFQGLLSACSPLGVRFQEQVAVAGIRQVRMANQRLADLFGPAAGTKAAPAPALAPAQMSAAAYLRAALAEWNMSLDDLARVEVVKPDGVPTPAELRARARRAMV